MRDGFKAAMVLLVLFTATALFRHATVPSAPLTGWARIVDGDTLAFGERRVRLLGIDAPERDQTCERAGTVYPCGQAATEELRALVGARPVHCAAEGHDRYGRDLARCAAEGGGDLGGAMVRRGFAVAYGGYAAEEAAARADRAGLWAGTFTAPSLWRRAHAASDPAGALPHGQHARGPIPVGADVADGREERR